MRYKYNFKIIVALLILLLTQLTGSAQAATKAGSPDQWALWGLASLVLFILFFVIFVMVRLRGWDGEEAEKRMTFKGWWSAVNQRILTKAIPVEKEADFVLDHEYDGIRELDNALPPWWKYGFYITIGVAVLYLLRFHVWKTGPDPVQEYNREMQTAAAQIEQYRKQANELVDEKTVTMADASGIVAGKQIFTTTCTPCHGQHGEGGVGPNLTDNYWLHGGVINDVFKTIKNGVPDKGMPSWEKSFSPSQLRELASFVKSLGGTNPPNPKAPQGDLFTEKKADSTVTAKEPKITAKK